jgi:hypothetical protein
MLPAPNLATAAPNIGSFGSNDQSAGTNYGSPRAPQQSNSQQNQDSYGSPQAAPQGPGQQQFGSVAAQNSYGSPQAGGNQDGGVISARPAQDSYGSPQSGVIAARPAQDSYGSPQNPFLSQYGNPQQSSPDLSGNFVPSSSSYGSPGAEAGINPRIKGNQISADEEVGARDVYGSPVAPVGTSAPVPDDIITAARLPDSYGASDDGPEGEVTELKVEGADPLFDNLRDNVFTTASLADATSQRPDPPASTTRDALKVDLSSSGEVDLTNGLDQDDAAHSSVDLTGNDDNYDDGATTTVVPLFPGYEDTDYDPDQYQYDESDARDPELPGYGRGQQSTYGNRPEPQLPTYGNRPQTQQQQPQRRPPSEQLQQRRPEAQQPSYGGTPASKPEVVIVETKQEEAAVGEQQNYGGAPEAKPDVVVVEQKDETVETVDHKEEEKIEEEVEVAQVEKEFSQVSEQADQGSIL